MNDSFVDERSVVNAVGLDEWSVVNCVNNWGGVHGVDSVNNRGGVDDWDAVVCIGVSMRENLGHSNDTLTS